MSKILAAARTLRARITVPTVVVAEWWRGQRGPIARILDGAIVEPLTEEVARVAGEALARTGGANAVDAIVMASAAQRGDIVYTGDVRDLSALSEHFAGVKVLSV